MSNSSNSSNDPAEAIVQMNDLQLAVRLDYAVAALFAYDNLITLSAEVQCMWSAKKSTVFWLFAGLRYSALLAIAMEIFSDFLPVETSKGCIWIIYLYLSMSVVSEACVHGILIVRTYAICNHNRSVLWVLAVLTIGHVVAVGMDAFSTTAHATDGATRTLTTCEGSNSNSFSSAREFIAETVLVLAFDAVVLALTMVKTTQHVLIRRRLKVSQGLTYHVFRDAISYFLSVDILVVITITVEELPAPFWLSTITNETEFLLSAILVQRLVLNLRQLGDTFPYTVIRLSDIESLDFGPNPDTSKEVAHGTTIYEAAGLTRASHEEEGALDVVEGSIGPQMDTTTLGEDSGSNVV